MKILLIDNYDSFTYNLYHYLSALGCKVNVCRNDKINIDKIKKNKYQKIIISPGPGNPNQAGNCLGIVKYFHKTIPILGVCLGHQIIGQVFRSKIIVSPASFVVSITSLEEYGENIMSKLFFISVTVGSTDLHGFLDITTSVLFRDNKRDTLE